jgi:signal transduction histidine kinase
VGDVRPRLGEGVAGLVAMRREGLIVNDYRNSPHAHPLFLERSLDAAVLCEPLLYRDRLLGVILLAGSPGDRQFSGEDQQLLRLFAVQVAIAIENARLHSAAVRRGEELEALLRATRSLMSDLDLQSILARIVAEASQMAGTPHVTVMLVDREAKVLRVAALIGDPVPTGFAIPLGQDLSGLVAETGQPVFSADSPNDPRNLLAARDRERGFVTYLGLPIKLRDEVLGVLTFDATTPRRYTPHEVAYLTSFAAQAAMAIEKARLYQAVRQHATTLEQHVRDRTRELEEARAQSEEASRHKSDFLANMSHELRTPLNSIIGFSQLLRDQYVGPLTEKQVRHLGHIHSAGMHLFELISDILDLAKVEAGKLTLWCDALPVAATLEGIRAIADALAGEKSQTLEFQVAPDLPPLRADPVRFKQICLNLLSNAVEFTPPEGRITLTARAVEGEGGRQAAEGSMPNSALGHPVGVPHSAMLEIRVQDTGIGIKADDLPRLFHEFTQLEQGATRRRKGTGLGLALTKRLVELHGGQIWAESEGEGRGSAFTVLLPFAGPPA